MNCYNNRITTFSGTTIFSSPQLLALNGFFYLGSGDVVECFKCRVQIEGWEPQDDAAKEHFKWSPMCPKARSMLPRNITQNFKWRLNTFVEYNGAHCIPQLVKDGFYFFKSKLFCYECHQTVAEAEVPIHKCGGMAFCRCVGSLTDVEAEVPVHKCGGAAFCRCVESLIGIDTPDSRLSICDSCSIKQ